MSADCDILRHARSQSRRQVQTMRRAPARGVALFIVLIFMLVLTMLGLTAMRAATTGEQIARNQVDKSRALQAAEAALRDAERDLLWLRVDDTYCKASDGSILSPCRQATRPLPDRIALFGGNTGNCEEGECYRPPPDEFNPPVWEDRAMWEGAAKYGQFTGAPALQAVAAQPKYLIEKFARGPTYYYRISALGFGADERTRVVLQSIYKPH